MVAFLADFSGEPALAGFISQLLAVVVLMQAVLPVWSSLMSPLHAWVARAFGYEAAMVGVVFATVTTVHLAGALMTVPALIGVTFGKIQVTKVASVKKLAGAMPLVGLNFILGVVVGSAVLIYAAKGHAHEPDFTAGLPSSPMLALQTGFSLLVTELIFYHVHRVFHENKRLYAKIHKIHHTWPAPVALVATYAHPIEHLGCNLLSIFAGPLLCGAHPAVILTYTLIFAVGAHAHHCGYWSDDMGMHDLHHEAFNVNFGNAHILDYLYGTYRLKKPSQLLAATVVQKNSCGVTDGSNAAKSEKSE
jgi:methylsterol monooxygenase